MAKENKVEQFRILWEEVLISNKLAVCTEELKDTGILDVNILRLLFNNSQIIPKEIAKRLNIPNSTLTNAINRLEKKGLIERKLNSNDLRSLKILLTQKGKEAICNHHDAEKALVKKIFNSLGENEVDSLIEIFSKIVKEL